MTGNGRNHQYDSNAVYQELARIFPDSGEELAVLATLAAQLSEALVPIHAPRAFRNQLHDNLVSAAEQRSAPTAPRRRRLPAPRTVGLAATASAVSVAVGVAAYWALSRARTAHG